MQSQGTGGKREVSLETETLSADQSPPSPPDPPSDEEAPSSSGLTILHLFHNLSSDSEPEDSNSEDSDSYGYSVLAVLETIPVPYKLFSGKATTTSRVPASEAKSMMACPHLAQSHQPPVLFNFSKEAAKLAKALFQNVTVSLPLQTVYKEIPALQCMLAKWEKELETAQDVLAVLPPFGKDTTQVEVSIQKVKIKAILDTGSPANVVSSKLMKKLKLAPDLNYTQSYGTAGMAQT